MSIASKKRTLELIDQIEAMFPDAECELVHQNVFELLIAVILSAQATDVSVNKVTPGLFSAFPTPEALAQAEQEEVISCIKQIGLYRNKAKNIIACAQSLVENFGGEVPQTMEELISLAGVGRKTASVVLGVAFDIPAFPVDTHVERVAKRLHLVKQSASVLEVEKTLCAKIPRERWNKIHHCLIFFGRYHCMARSPKCTTCPLQRVCPTAPKLLV